VDVRTLKRWLSGRRAFLENIAAIAAALRVAPEALIADHAPAELPAPPRQVTTFSLQLTVTGTIRSAEQARVLAELPASVLTELARAGIQIAASDARLSIEHRAEELTRTIVLIFGTLDTGNSCWVYAAIRPSMYSIFVREQAAGRVDMYNFVLWGEIIVSAEGDKPSFEITKKVRDLYQVPLTAEEMHAKVMSLPYNDRRY